MFIVIKLENLQIKDLREPLKIHFIGQANLFDSGRRQIKAALVSAKADLSWLPEHKNLLLANQKQLLEPPLIFSSANLILFLLALVLNLPDLSIVILLTID